MLIFIYNKKWEQPIIQVVLILHTNIITRTGIEPVTPPWEGDVLTDLTSGQSMFGELINKTQALVYKIYGRL